MLDRTITPAFGKIDTIDLMEPAVHHLNNGLPVFTINAGIQDVLKIELVFATGTATSDKKLLASTTNKLLTGGTSTHSAKEIAEAVDFYGAYLQTEIAHDDSSLCLYSLNKHLDRTIGTLAEVYQSPIFPEREVETHLLKGRQEMLVNMEKVSYLGAKAFSAALYGSEHPYGRSALPEDYQQVAQSELVAFHDSFLKNRIQHILVSGKLSPTTIQTLNRFFGEDARLPLVESTIETKMNDSVIQHIDKASSVQNSIKMGRVLFDRTHKDFTGLRILTTVLGGYFGSRLMTNIREDKGYTYGIGAGLVSLKNSGYLSISTEVGSDVCEAATNEIYKEIERLRKHLIPTAELELVRNYMLGSILKSLDGPFQIADKWKAYLKYGLGLSTHHNQIRQIQTITPERLRELAEMYLKREDLVQITAGSSPSV